MGKSTAFAPHVVRGMLYNAIKGYCVNTRKDVDLSAQWVGGSSQQSWLDMINRIPPGYLKALGKRLKTFGSSSKDECNNFLAQEGFSIKLKDFVGLNPVGGVAVLHVGVEWEYVGDEDRIYVSDRSGNYQEYDAATIT